VKILITGSAGFIGYHLTKSLIRDGYDVCGIDNIDNYYDKSLKKDRLELLMSYDNFIFNKIDIADFQSVSNIFNEFKPHKVVHLAAQPGINNNHISKEKYISSNLIGFTNVIECCRTNNVNGFIYASSSTVYGDTAKLPSSVKDEVNNPISFYGVTKRFNELTASMYSCQYELKTTGLRYFTVYGPWYRPDMAIFRFIKSIIAKKPISVYNNGNMSRDFTYIDDIIIGTRAAIDKNYKCEIFNIGKGQSIKLLDMIDLIEKELGIKAIMNFQPIRDGEAIKTFADIKYSQEKIGFYPKINFTEGVPKVINWYKEYYNV